MGRTVYYDYNGNMIDPPRADQIKPTNGDRIRAMTDEELASFMEGLSPSKNWSLFLDEKRWLDWLKKEANT